jgi:hypothetical protein
MTSALRATQLDQYHRDDYMVKPIDIERVASILKGA